jgi:hypothetical protein
MVQYLEVPYQTPMLKYADYVGETTDIVVLVYCNYILSKSNKNFFLLKNLISVVFLTNFSSAKFIVFMLSDNEIFKMSFRKSRVASAASPSS